LRRHIDTQFAMLANQLTACRAEVAAAHAALKAAKANADSAAPQRDTIIH